MTIPLKIKTQELDLCLCSVDSEDNLAAWAAFWGQSSGEGVEVVRIPLKLQTPTGSIYFMSWSKAMQRRLPIKSFSWLNKYQQNEIAIIRVKMLIKERLII